MKVNSQISPQQISSEQAQRAHDEMDKKLWHVAKLYEKQFLNEMVKAMRGTVTYGSMTKPNMGEQIYREQLDQEYVENWSESGGAGLSQVIFKELKEKILPQSMGQKFTQPLSEPKKPVKSDIKEIKKIPSQVDGQTSFLIEHELDKENLLLSPWEAQVKSIQEMPNKHQLVTLEHPWGFRSRMVFEGKQSDLKINQSLSPGDTIAKLDPNAQRLIWNIQKG